MSRSYFRVPRRTHDYLRFLDIKSRPVDIIMCCSPQEFSTLELHWQDGGSVLCQGELFCPLCEPTPHPKRLYSYAPVLHNMSDKTWQRAILPVGDIEGPVGDRDFRGMRLRVHRERRADKTWSMLKIQEAVKVDPVLLSAIGANWFDIKPRLLRRYGISIDAVASPLERAQDELPVEQTPGDAFCLTSFAEALKNVNGKAG